MRPLNAGLVISCMLILILSYSASHAPSANGVSLANQVPFDNGFAMGSYLSNYGRNYGDFYYYFYNNGLSGSNGAPEQNVLSVTADGYAFQMAIWVYGSGTGKSTQLDDEVWSVSSAKILYQNTITISGLSNSWHTLNLHIYHDSNGYHVQYYLDGGWENAWGIGSVQYFDTEMVPNIAIESNDLTGSDWQGHYATGYLEGPSQATLSTYFYGGSYGWTIFGCGNVLGNQQTSGLAVGQDTMPPSLIGVTGHAMTSYGSTHQVLIGDIFSTAGASANAIDGYSAAIAQQQGVPTLCALNVT